MSSGVPAQWQSDRHGNGQAAEMEVSCWRGNKASGLELRQFQAGRTGARRVSSGVSIKAPQGHKEGLLCQARTCSITTQSSQREQHFLQLVEANVVSLHRRRPRLAG